MMKILVVMDAIGTGGISSAFLNFIKVLSKEAECDILIFNDESVDRNSIPNSVKILKSGWPLKLLGMPQKSVKERSIIWALVRTLFVITSKVSNGNIARKLLFMFVKNSSKYDVAISYAQDVGWKTLARGCNDYVLQKVEAQFKCAYIHCDYEKFGGFHSGQENTYNKFDNIFCVSEGCRESFVRCFPNLREKTRVMENFIDVEAVRKKAKEYKISSKMCKNIVTVCRVSEEKGIQRTINVIERLKNQGYKFCWTIVGDGEDFCSVKKLIENKELSNYIELVGMKKNTFPYVAKADVFLLPSFHEAAPMVFGECWALGIPVISTETSSAREMVEENKIGIVCQNSEEGIYKALKQFLDEKINTLMIEGLKYGNVNEIPYKNLKEYLSLIGDV